MFLQNEKLQNICRKLQTINRKFQNNGINDEKKL